MAKTSKKEQQERKNTLKTASKQRSQVRWQVILLAAIAFLMYAQTLRFGLVMDDKMVINDHSVVQQGVSGIGTLLTKDSFYGFDTFYDRASQRKTYRPVSFVSFAVEKQLWNNNPIMGHLVNTVLYTITVVLVFMLLRRLFAKHIEQQPDFVWLPFSAALLFAVHPIHTSVVANIKSRDELFALMFAVLSAILLFEYIRSNSLKHVMWSVFCFALALFSKESAVLMLPVICVFMPATFTDLDAKKRVMLSLPYIAVTMLFLAIWFGLVGRVEEGMFAYKLHNPFAGASFAERTATGFLLVGVYCLKAIFPFTLSEGYTYNQIPLVGWTDWRVIASLLLVLGLLVFAGMRFRAVSKHDTSKRWERILAFCVVSFFTTLILASNLVVYAGSLIGERFLFTPSLFVVIALAYGVFVLFGAETKQFRRTFALGTVLVLASVYAVRGLARLPDWVSDYKLLQTDHRSTPESMMTARNYASQLLVRIGKTQNVTEQSILLDEAEAVLNRAVAVDSSADAALYDLQALCALQRKNFDRAFRLEERAMKLDSASRDSIHQKPIFRQNLAAAFVSRAAQRINQDSITLGKSDLQAALRLNPKSETAYLNLGMVFGKQQQLDSALAYFQAAFRINPRSETAQQYIYAIQQAKREAMEAQETVQNPSFK
jgi:tetratricopeptide (TPR) repeat protein